MDFLTIGDEANMQRVEAAEWSLFVQFLI